MPFPLADDLEIGLEETGTIEIRSHPLLSVPSSLNSILERCTQKGNSL